MTENQAALTMLKGTIVDMEPEEQAKIKEYADKFRAIVSEASEKGDVDEGCCQIAIALIGFETTVALGQ